MTAFTSGFVTPGVIKGFAESSTSVTKNGIGPSIGSDSFSNIGYTDLITVTSDSLAPGTPVQLRLTANFSSSIDRSVSQFEGGRAEGGAMIRQGLMAGTATNAALYANFYLCYFEGWTLGIPNNCGTQGNLQASRILNLAVGDTFYLMGGIELKPYNAVVNTDHSVGFTSQSLSADASNSNRTILEVLTQGASFQSQLGGIYTGDDPTDVPEPTTFALAAACLLVLAARRIGAR